MSRDTTLDAERRSSPPGDFETAIARQCRSPVEALKKYKATKNRNEKQNKNLSKN